MTDLTSLLTNSSPTIGAVMVLLLWIHRRLTKLEERFHKHLESCGVAKSVPRSSTLKRVKNSGSPFRRNRQR